MPPESLLSLTIISLVMLIGLSVAALRNMRAEEIRRQNKRSPFAS